MEKNELSSVGTPGPGSAWPRVGALDAIERRNHLLHVIEGATLIGALGAINSNTVGTSLVESLGGSAWLVALMPIAASVGFAIGPILSAHWLDRQTEFLPVLRRTLPLSRLPILLTSLVLWGFGKGPLSLWTVVLSALAYGVIGGSSVGAWQQLILRTVRPDRRPALFAVRYLVSNVVGLGVASLVGPVLARWPGTGGYALLHLVAFLGAMLSYRVLMGVREPAAGAAALPPPLGFVENLRGLPGLLASDRRLSSYLWSVVLVNSQYVMMAFLAVHALQVLRASPSYIGSLTSAQLVGAVGATAVAARLGSQCGSRALLIASRLLLLAVALGAVAAKGDGAFRALFAMYGAATWINLVGHNTMSLELLPPERRSTVLALFSLVQVPSMLAAGALGAWLWYVGLPFHWLAALSAVGLLGSLVPLLPVSPVLARQRG